VQVIDHLPNLIRPDLIDGFNFDNNFVECDQIRGIFTDQMPLIFDNKALLPIKWNSLQRKFYSKCFFIRLLK